MNYVLGDRVRVIGQEYGQGMYDVIVDITIDKYVIEDGCTYKNRKESYPQMNMLELILWVSLMWIILYSGIILIS